MHGFWLDTLISSKDRYNCGAGVNVNIKITPHLKNHAYGVTMKKCKVIAEEQGTLEPKLKKVPD